MNSKMRVVQVIPKHGYVDDGLMSNHVTDFLYDEKFMNAYKEGKKTGSSKNTTDIIRSELYSGDIHYRAYIACYFAKYCSKLDGDFVECGVGKGLLSKTIVSYLNFAKINKNFFLFDTYEGIPIHQGKDCEIENMNFLNNIYADGSNYIESNIKILKEKLDKERNERIGKISLEIINEFKDKFSPINTTSKIIIGDSYSKINKLLGEPENMKKRNFLDNEYLMVLYSINNKNYRLYFKDNILFELEEIQWDTF